MNKIILNTLIVFFLYLPCFSQELIIYTEKTIIIDVNIAQNLYFENNLYRFSSFDGKEKIKIPYKQELKKDRRTILLDNQLFQYEWTIYPDDIDITLLPTKVLYREFDFDKNEIKDDEYDEDTSKWKDDKENDLKKDDDYIKDKIKEKDKKPKIKQSTPG